ncbi:MAG: 16S rRNA (adenine(1518)-N(6)/adenine(1519)-N(6))-dimethyltransferase RsmA [Eubacteriales bacterium]|nr:16S rRNA (adenine(1518)-N(6)/adenine(1519)-N(6))-dimethyltransferase RsmA [Eubacteriales bacterium]
MIKVKEEIKKNNFYIKKSLGQNFLIDENILSKIIKEIYIHDKTLTIEIGPGLGNLTEKLVENSNYTIAIEKDKSLENIINKNIKQNNFKLIIEDFLKSDLNNVLSNFTNEGFDIKKYKILFVSNLPYYITQKIIMKIITSDIQFETLTVMIQKEVSDRIFAKPYTKDYGILTLFVQYYSIPKFLFNVSRNSFFPVPNVDSSLIQFAKKNDKEKLPLDEEKKLIQIIKASFAQRRKTLINSLYNELHIDKNTIKEILNKININENVRAEELTLEHFKILSKEIKK